MVSINRFFFNFVPGGLILKLNQAPSVNMQNYWKKWASSNNFTAAETSCLMSAVSGATHTHAVHAHASRPH
jgi:hypothetical protein